RYQVKTETFSINVIPVVESVGKCSLCLIRVNRSISHFTVGSSQLKFRQESYIRQEAFIFYSPSEGNTREARPFISFSKTGRSIPSHVCLKQILSFVRIVDTSHV